MTPPVQFFAVEEYRGQKQRPFTIPALHTLDTAALVAKRLGGGIREVDLVTGWSVVGAQHVHESGAIVRRGLTPGEWVYVVGDTHEAARSWWTARWKATGMQVGRLVDERGRPV